LVAPGGTQGGIGIGGQLLQALCAKVFNSCAAASMPALEVMVPQVETHALTSDSVPQSVSVWQPLAEAFCKTCSRCAKYFCLPASHALASVPPVALFAPDSGPRADWPPQPEAKPRANTQPRASIRFIDTELRPPKVQWAVKFGARGQWEGATSTRPVKR
jgi:hypothetical protein